MLWYVGWMVCNNELKQVVEEVLVCRKVGDVLLMADCTRSKSK